MRVWVLKLFGREILRTETHQEATVSDVVRAMLAQRLAGVREDEDENLIECECCGEMFDPEEVESEVDARFADMTENLTWDERLVWDVKGPDEEEE